MNKYSKRTKTISQYTPTTQSVISTELLLNSNLGGEPIFHQNSKNTKSQKSKRSRQHQGSRNTLGLTPNSSAKRINQKAKSNYAYYKKNVLLKDGYYELIEAKNRQNGQMRVAKVIDKSKLRLSGYLVQKVKTEILLHQNLLGSECILRLEAVFETNNHLYMIYEHFQLFGENELIKLISYDKRELKKHSCSVLIALNEINSLKICVGLLDYRMIALTSQDNRYKLFNFAALGKYGDGISELNKCLRTGLGQINQFFHPDHEMNKKLDLRTDTYHFGIFMAKLLKPHSSFTNRPFSMEVVRSIQRDPHLDKKERDLLSGMLALDKMNRLAISDILVHEYYRELFNGMSYSGVNFSEILSRTNSGAYKKLDAAIDMLEQELQTQKKNESLERRRRIENAARRHGRSSHRLDQDYVLGKQFGSSPNSFTRRDNPGIAKAVSPSPASKRPPVGSLGGIFSGRKSIRKKNLMKRASLVKENSNLSRGLKSVKEWNQTSPQDQRARFVKEGDIPCNTSQRMKNKSVKTNKDPQMASLEASRAFEHLQQESHLTKGKMTAKTPRSRRSSLMEDLNEFSPKRPQGGVDLRRKKSLNKLLFRSNENDKKGNSFNKFGFGFGFGGRSQNVSDKIIRTRRNKRLHHAGSSSSRDVSSGRKTGREALERGGGVGDSNRGVSFGGKGAEAGLRRKNASAMKRTKTIKNLRRGNQQSQNKKKLALRKQELPSAAPKKGGFFGTLFNMVCCHGR